MQSHKNYNIFKVVSLKKKPVLYRGLLWEERKGEKEKNKNRKLQQNSTEYSGKRNKYSLDQSLSYEKENSFFEDKRIQTVKLTVNIIKYKQDVHDKHFILISHIRHMKPCSNIYNFSNLKQIDRYQ